MRTEETDVVIVGAGVAGLAMAVEVFRRGLRARVLERSTTGLPDDQGALFQPAALERLAAVGLYDGLRTEGAVLESLEIRAAEAPDPVLAIPAADAGLAFPHALAVPLGTFERVALETFEKFAAIRIERGTELLSLARERGRVVGAVARAADGDVTFRGRLVIVTTGSGGAPIRAEAGAATRSRPYDAEHASFAVERHEGSPDRLGVWLGPGLWVAAHPISSALARVEVIAPGRTLSAARAAGVDAVRRLVVGVAPALEPALKRLPSADRAIVTPVVRSRVSSWVADGVALTGPAAYGMSPAGLGVESHAVLDAAALALVLSRASFTGDFSRPALLPYELRRRPAVETAARLAHDLHHASLHVTSLQAHARSSALRRLAGSAPLGRKLARLIACADGETWALADRLRAAAVLPVR